MGKQKRQRNKPHKQNPTGLASIKDFDEINGGDVTNEDKENALQRVYEEVQSADIEEKLSGLQTLEAMSCNPILAIRISKDGIAKLIGPLLVDQNVHVRIATASALRRIADNGKTEAYEHLLNDDIMTALTTLLKQYHASWQPKQEQNDKMRLNNEKESFIEAVNLLWTLCENNERAIKYSNEEDLVSILLKFFDINSYGIEVATITGQCLLSLSEDNPTALTKLKTYEEALLDLLNLEPNDFTVFDVLCLKTVIVGLIINLTGITENNPMSAICKAITVLSETLTIDCKELLSNLTSILPHEKNSVSSSAKRKVQENKRMLGAQQLALEILANLCSEEEEIQNDSDLEDSDEGNEEVECPEDVPMDEKFDRISSALPLEVVEVFHSCDIVKKVIAKTIAVDKDTEEILEQNDEGKTVLKQMHTLRCRAYLCLNNFMSTLEMDSFGGVDSIFRIWVEIGTVVFTESSSNDIELLESATAALRAAVQCLSEAKANIFNKLTVEDIQPILNGEKQCSNANVRANLIRILGNLALLLVNSNISEMSELIKYVSEFLLEACMTESEAWVMAEILDTIMDIYAEDGSDRVAKDVQLVEKLQAAVPLFKNKVRQQKKKLGDNASVVSTVNANIMRFIKYKGKRIKLLT